MTRLILGYPPQPDEPSAEQSHAGETWRGLEEGKRKTRNLKKKKVDMVIILWAFILSESGYLFCLRLVCSQLVSWDITKSIICRYFCAVCTYVIQFVFTFCFNNIVFLFFFLPNWQHRNACQSYTILCWTKYMWIDQGIMGEKGTLDIPLFYNVR